MTQKKLLTGAEAAELMGISSILFYRLRREGKIPVEPAVGRYYARTEVLAWLDAGCPDAETWENVKADFIKKGAFTDGK